MITPSQKADLLFKKMMGKGSSNVPTWEYHNESYNGRAAVLPDQIWAQTDKIPVPAIPTDSEVVEYHQDLVLTQVEGATGSFYHPNLVGAIPFTFDRSYMPTVKKADGTIIPLGMGDWILDGDSGQLTFYSFVPTGMPPKVTFWRYIGQKGAFSNSTKVKDFISGQIEPPTVDNVYYLVNVTPTAMDILSLNIALLSGSGKVTVYCDSTPIPGLEDIVLTSNDVLNVVDGGGFTVPIGSTVSMEMKEMSVNASRTRFTLTLARALA